MNLKFFFCLKKRSGVTSLEASGECAKGKRNSIAFSLSSFLFPIPVSGGHAKSSALNGGGMNPRNQSVLSRFKQRNLSTCSNTEAPSGGMSHQNALFASTDNLNLLATHQTCSDKHRIKSKSAAYQDEGS